MPPLVSSGVVVRYFLDEATSGTAMAALDSGRAPALDLPRSGSSNGPFYATSAQGVSAQWDSAAGGGGYIDQVSSKIIADLDNTQRLTIEVVVDLDDATAFGSRLVHIGTGSTTYLGLIITEELVVFPINGSLDIRWEIMVGALSGPTVLTVVFDSTQSNINDRIDFYVNGAPGPVSQIGPGPNVQFNLATTDSFVIGNRPNGSRSIEGRIGYVALYDHPLSPQEVAANAAALLVSHDTR